MRFVTFKSLEAKNFLSFGDKLTQIKLHPGVNAITGTNLDKEDSKNGAGKSSVTEILYYALYGTTLREIGKDYVQNSITKKQPEIAINFDVTVNNTTDSYKIVRKLNPTKCLFFKNNEDVTRSTLAKTNKLIQDIVHTPATVFQNSVIMSVNNALPFMALPKTDRRKFIESVLGLEIFTSMVLKIRDDYSIVKKDYEIAYNKLDQLKTELAFNQTQLTNYETLKQERLAKLDNKKNILFEDIRNLEKQLEEKTNYTQQQECTTIISDIDKDIQTTQDKVNNCQAQLHKAEAEKNSEEKQIKQLTINTDKCPTCNRDYSQEHNEHIQELIAKHKFNISKYNEATEKITEILTNYKTVLKTHQEKRIETLNKKNTLEKINSDIENVKTSIKHLKQNLVEANEEIAQVSSEHNNSLKSKVADLGLKAQESEEKVGKYNNELNILETVKFVISEEGIKSYIVKKILKVLNSRLAYYLKKLEANCLCQFNEFFDEEIIDENSQAKSYFNFSGGERKRIDLACLFAFADIRRLQGDVNFSTVFYDELLDSSLDDRGVLLTLRVLRERFQENNESCYIITHRGPEVLSKAEHVIKVTKQSGISTVTS